MRIYNVFFGGILVSLMPQYGSCVDSSAHAMYNTYAQYYDQFYSVKKYYQEALYVHTLLSEHESLAVLDLGCGTGTHLAYLEQFGYKCVGFDINQEMLELAKLKVKSRVIQADMRNFELNEQFDAIISMFAVFNHNLADGEALATLLSIKKHLNENGLLILDLYNPQSSGEKIEKHGNITRTMKWQLDQLTSICMSSVSFALGDLKHESLFPLKIYSMKHIEKLLMQCGYRDICFYDNYTTQPGIQTSKNLIVVAYN